MSLKGKKGSTSTVKKKKVAQSKFIVSATRLSYPPLGLSWKMPINLGKQRVAALGDRPLLVEYYYQGNKHYLLYYDEKVGLIAKATLPARHARYILQELISRQGNIPQGGLVDEQKLDEILRDSTRKDYL